MLLYDLVQAMLEAESIGMAKVKELQLQLGREVRSLLASLGIKSVAADGFGAPGTLRGVCHFTKRRFRCMLQQQARIVDRHDVLSVSATDSIFFVCGCVRVQVSLCHMPDTKTCTPGSFPQECKLLEVCRSCVAASQTRRAMSSALSASGCSVRLFCSLVRFTQRHPPTGSFVS